MTVALVLLLVVAVIVLAAYLRSTETVRPRRAPKPGEGLPGPAGLGGPVEEAVVLRTLKAEEAHVVRGLLESSGIPVALRGVDGDLTARTRTPPRAFRVLVPADRVEEAEALLRG